MGGCTGSYGGYEIPRSSESFKKNRSALSHELPMT
jgi:hypothetical protein